MFSFFLIRNWLPGRRSAGTRDGVIRFSVVGLCRVLVHTAHTSNESRTNERTDDETAGSEGNPYGWWEAGLYGVLREGGWERADLLVGRRFES